MRRLVAAVSMLSFASLMLVQVTRECPLSGATSHETVAAESGHAQHEGHGGSLGATGDAVQSIPDSDTNHESACLTMGPCQLTIDIGRMVVAASTPGHPAGVMARPDQRPSSLTSSPELPPPRA
jgi:hypothetical protein